MGAAASDRNIDKFPRLGGTPAAAYSGQVPEASQHARSLPHIPTGYHTPGYAMLYRPIFIEYLALPATVS